MTVREHRLAIHNSWTRAKEKFVPLVPGHIGIYVCGPTVYSDTHLGHAKSYVSFDVVVRYLRYLGFKVRYVQNITDVGHLTDNSDDGEDKLLKRARLDQVHPMELAERYTRLYFRDMDALKVTRPDISPRASGHIPEQLEMVRELIRRGHAYEVKGNVYFSVKSWPAYGRLSGREVEDTQEGTRVQVREDKRDPRDFALWKRAEGGHILRWETEWGAGFPGWHIECSAMSSKYLGETFDIHGAGLDNQFPHHECEIAQSHAAGQAFARYWMHNNLVNVDGQKMSKSLGNFTSVKQALAKHSGEVVRFWILSSHYRSPVNYTNDALDAAKTGLDRIANCRRALRELAKDTPPSETAFVTSARAAFQTAMDDDFNTPVAIAALFELIREINTAISEGRLSAGEAAAAEVALSDLGGSVLGILPSETASAAGDAAPFVDLLVALRADLKGKKLFDLGDTIRDRLSALKIEIRDGKGGTQWSTKS